MDKNKMLKPIILGELHDEDLLSINQTIRKVINVKNSYFSTISQTMNIDSIFAPSMLISQRNSYGNGVVWGQINHLEFTYYPSEGIECELLILGEKKWRKGRIKVHGNMDFNSILEEMPKPQGYSPDDRKAYELKQANDKSRSDFLKERNMKKDDMVKITMIVEFQQDSEDLLDIQLTNNLESPLDDIRREIQQNSQ